MSNYRNATEARAWSAITVRHTILSSGSAIWRILAKKLCQLRIRYGVAQGKVENTHIMKFTLLFFNQNGIDFGHNVPFFHENQYVLKVSIKQGIIKGGVMKKFLS